MEGQEYRHWEDTKKGFVEGIVQDVQFVGLMEHVLHVIEHDTHEPADFTNPAVTQSK